jgi:Domain of unknown function (DUF1929)/Glyoxal oxidase N-terminus/Bacterial Ig-like domain (group 2)
MPICPLQSRRTVPAANISRCARLLLVLCAVLAGQAAFGQTLVSITVTQIYDTQSSSSLGVAAVRQFTATGNYSDGTQQYLTQQVAWSSENTGLATVSPTMGLVTAVAPGTLNIDATLSGITGKSSLTVIARNLTAVAITPVNWAMKVGTSQQFSATAEYGDGTMQNVTGSATWSSSTPTVATVSSSGSVTAVGVGTSMIAASYSPGKGSTTLTVSTTAPPNLGVWSAPQSSGTTAINTALLNTGKVLFFAYPNGRSGGPSPAYLWDPIANMLTDLTIPWPIDIFCSALSFLPDGRLLVDGGTDDGQNPSDSGIANGTLFDPSTNLWSQGAAMTYPRWYPTTVVLPNGTVLAASGAAHDGVTIQQALETYDPTTNAWTVLPTSANIPRPIDLYPLLITLGNGNVFYAAPRQNSIELNLRTNVWSSVANMNFGTRYHAAAVLEPGTQNVMVVGGATTDTGGGSGPTNTTEIINLAAATPAWMYGTPLNIARYNHNLLFLADGSLLVVGGDQSQHYTSPVYQPELYNFTTKKWTLLPAQNAVRAYHSTAVLLPDGRVVSAGSDAGTPLDGTYEIYSPAYLSNGPRPTITSSPSSITYKQQFTIVTPQAAVIKKVAILRPGSTTHAVHMDDYRYVPLKFTVGSGQITVTAPANANLAPPGYYMLVILNAKGIPSVMPFVQVQ